MSDFGQAPYWRGMAPDRSGAPKSILSCHNVMQRRPAAILAADVVGYSRLMGADEIGTLRHSRRIVVN
jgi:class 3 adenylate cyclase